MPGTSREFTSRRAPNSGATRTPLPGQWSDIDLAMSDHGRNELIGGAEMISARWSLVAVVEFSR